jgi:hypothetical protein
MRRKKEPAKIRADQRTKRCKKCLLLKSVTMFHKQERGDGFRARCKACIKAARATTTPKKCAECRELKPADQFRGNGSSAYCRPCDNKRTLAYRRGAGRKAYEKRRAAYFASAHGKAMRAKHMRNYKARNRNNPQFRARILARAAVYAAVRTGKLRKPRQCQACGRTRSVQAHHHHGYDDAHRLDVAWMCVECHRAAEAG